MSYHQGIVAMLFKKTEYYPREHLKASLLGGWRALHKKSW